MVTATATLLLYMVMGMGALTHLPHLPSRQAALADSSCRQRQSCWRHYESRRSEKEREKEREAVEEQAE